MNSTVKKHSILIGRRTTSTSLEDVFWTSLQQIARGRQVTRSDLVASFDAARKNTNLSSAVRVFILDHYRAMAVATAIQGGARSRAVCALIGEVMGKHGGDRKSEEARNQADNISLNSGYGTNRAYALRRRKRDRPDLAELTANAAAIRQDLMQ